MAGHASLTELRTQAPVILPSLLLCDFGHLADELAKVEAAGVKALHLDVMDGYFVPNFSYGQSIVAAVRKLSRLPLDVHLMVAEPERFIQPFRDAGADGMTIHVEATRRPAEALRQIRACGATAGLALNLETPISAVEQLLPDCDLVLVMSVSPGFGGQAFNPVALEKLSHLRRCPGNFVLEVDGGVNLKTIAACAQAGAQWFVTGSAIFGQPDYAASVQALTHAANVPVGG